MEADNIDLNRASFRDCFSSALLERLSLRPRTTTKRRPARSKKNLGSYVKEEDPHLADADDLADFIEVQCLRSCLSVIVLTALVPDI